MGKISIVKKHTLSIEKAREKANEALATLGKEYGIEGDWNDEGTVFYIRKPAEGYLQLHGDLVAISLELPLALSLFAGTIQARVHEQLDAALGR